MMSFNLDAKILYKYVPLMRELLSKMDYKFQAIYFTNEGSTSTDGERTLNLKLATNEESNIAINGQVFSDVIRSGGSQGVWSFVFDKKNIKLSKDKANVDLILMDVEKPENTLLNIKICCKIESLLFKNAIKSVLFAIASSDQKPILKGLSMKFKDDSVEFVCTDGYRLAYSFMPLSSNIQAQLVISQKTMASLLHLLDVSAGEIELGFDENGVCFKGVGELNVHWELYSSILAGAFPNYDSFLNKEYESQFECDAISLYEAVNQVGVIAKENQIVKLLFTHDKVQLTSAHVNIGQFENEVSGRLYTENEYIINFRYNFLAQILQAFSKSKVLFHLQNRGTILFTSLEVPNVKYVLLPIG